MKSVAESLISGLIMFYLYVRLAVQLRAYSARHQLDGRGACILACNMADDACRIAPILCAVGGVDLLVDIWIGFLHEADFLLDTACLDATFVALLHPSEPGGSASVYRPDIQVIPEPDNPDRHRVSQGAIPSQRRDQQLLCRPDLVKLIVRPCSHNCVSFLTWPLDTCTSPGTLCGASVAHVCLRNTVRAASTPVRDGSAGRFPQIFYFQNLCVSSCP